MLFAAWWRAGTSLDPLRVPDAPGRTAVTLPNAVIWATTPSRLLGSTDVSGWLRPTEQECDVRLTQRGLFAAAGLLPQLPLYYARDPADRWLLVCSELGPLRRAGLGASVSIERLVSLIASQLDAYPAGTAFKGICRLRPAEHVAIDQESVRIERRFPSAGQHYTREAPADLANALRGELDAAVGRAIGKAKRVSVLVGGGLDSSGLLALAVRRARASGGWDVEPLAQAWASPGDDRPHLREVERYLAIEAIRVTARDAGPWFRRSLTIDGQPQSFAAGCGEMLLWRTAGERGADVILSAHAGDDVCGGPPFITPLVSRGHPLRAISTVLRFEGPWSLTAAGRLRSWLLSPLLRPFAPKRLLVAHRLRTLRKPWMTKRFLQVLEPMLQQGPRAYPSNPDQQLIDLCDLPYLGELSRAWGQFACETGAAPVDVFRDPELVRFIARIDPTELTMGGRHRGLYREAMKGLLPDTVRLRRDKATPQPMVAAAAVAADALPFLQSLSTLDRTASLGLLDPHAFRGPFAEWMRCLGRGERLESDPTDRWWEWMWPTLAVEAFLRALDGQSFASTEDAHMG